MAEPAPMPSTLWTFIGRVRTGDAREFGRFVERYRLPVLSFVRGALRDREEAEDVTQEIFVALFQGDVLAKADRTKGKLRSLLLAVAKHVISGRRRAASAQRRGGGRPLLSLHATEEGLEPVLPAAEVDETFDSLWVENLVRLGMSHLQEESREKGTPYFDALFAHVNDGLGYAEIGRKLGGSPTDVKNYLHQARLRLRRHILGEIQDCSFSRLEYEEEVNYLMGFLR